MNHISKMQLQFDNYKANKTYNLDFTRSDEMEQSL